MKTRLYNIETQEFISKQFNEGYFVDGKKPSLPDNIVELELINNSIPDYDPKLQKIKRIELIDLIANTYTNDWEF